jgi:hypothetical protein
MTARNLKTVAILVQIPIELAEEIFRESGNLAISEFPATLEFAESLAEVINLDQKETAGFNEPTLLVQNNENILISTKRKK